MIKAIGLICTCKLIFSIQDIIIKEMSAGYPVHQIMVIRGIVALALLYSILLVRNEVSTLRRNSTWPLMIRGGLMFGSFTTFYLALSMMELTTATVLFFTAPFFIAILSIPMLGESVGVRRWIGISLGFFGVIIVIRPAGEDFGIYSLLPVLSAILYSIAQIMARKLGIQASALVMTFYANIVFVFLGVVTAISLIAVDPPHGAGKGMEFLMRSWTLPGALDGFLLLVTGLTAAIGFLFSTQAYRIAEVNVVAPFEYVMLVWVSILSYLMWQEVPDFYTVIGTVIIVLAGLYVVKRDTMKSERPLLYKGLSRAR